MINNIDIESLDIIKDIIRNEDKIVSIVLYNENKCVLKKVISNNKLDINMLKNEVNLLNFLKVTNITPKIIYYKFNDKDNYLITEYIEGKSINELLFNNNREKVLLILKIIDAVKVLHKYNIVHCDLKPSNIIIDVNNNIKIIDFGISSYNNSNYFKGSGTLKYCSKNQILKDDIDFKTDIYSLGIILYELIFDNIPFDVNNIKETKINNKFYKTNNVFLNLIFSKVFDNKYSTIDDFENDLKLLIMN